MFLFHPGLSLRSNPGLKLANAFGVNPGAETRGRRRIYSKLKLTCYLREIECDFHRI